VPNRQIRTQQLIRRLHTNKINNSANFLLGKRQYLADYEDIEDFAVETVDWCPENLRGLEHHFVTVRSALAKELWSRQFFLGVTVLDSLLFRAMKDASVNELVDHVLGLIVDL
jgi:hypothetical protein